MTTIKRNWLRPARLWKPRRQPSRTTGGNASCKTHVFSERWLGSIWPGRKSRPRRRAYRRGKLTERGTRRKPPGEKHLFPPRTGRKKKGREPRLPSEGSPP